MAFTLVSRGILFSLVIVIFTILASTEANWYGKRGDKVDDALYSLLGGNVPGMIDRQLDAQMTLRSIGKLINDYQLRQLEHVDGKGGAK